MAEVLVTPTHSVYWERNRNVVKPRQNLRGRDQRLALMEYDIRPHEAYDTTISALFIVLMLVVIALAVVAF